MYFGMEDVRQLKPGLREYIGDAIELANMDDVAARYGMLPSEAAERVTMYDMLCYQMGKVRDSGIADKTANRYSGGGGH